MKGEVWASFNVYGNLLHVLCFTSYLIESITSACISFYDDTHKHDVHDVSLILISTFLPSENRILKVGKRRLFIS